MKKRITAVLAITLALAACGESSNSSSDTTALARTKNAALPQRATTTMATRATPTTVGRNAPSTTKAPASTATSTTLAPVTVPATGPNTCRAQGPCKVGQTGPAGGIVFYVAAAPQKWGQFMEVRPGAFEQFKYDSCNIAAYDSYAAGKVGDGLTQSIAVIAACAKDAKPTAAGSYGRVDAYTQNGYDDWFIPAKDELQALLDSKVIAFPTDKDLTSGTWANKPQADGNRSFDVVYGVKKEVLAGTAASSRGGAVKNVELMSDGPQSYGNPNNRWGFVYIARAFGPKA